MGKFRFAIMGAGKIAVKFCSAAASIKDCEVAAVSSKSCERAQAFAADNHIPAAYGSYEQMLRQEKPDCVYIATTPDSHYELTMLCLQYRTPVLCEKAMFLNAAQAQSAFELAAKENVFVMEALWSRFLPALRRAEQWYAQGRIGRASFLEVTIGFRAPADPRNRYFNASLGGGAAYDLTVYAYELARLFIKEPLEEVQTSSVIGETGVDVTDHVVLRGGSVLAGLSTSFLSSMEERLTLYGTEGRIVLPRPHMAKEALLICGDRQEHFVDTKTQNGFVYEIAETIRCVRSRQAQSETVPHRLTLDCAAVLERLSRAHQE